ncbi:MAG: patatin-like phospholipase family protein [Lentisphaeria bacterium]|nr:patatin-like phospholipase family protein [Lentisphaeria bacterium]
MDDRFGLVFAGGGGKGAWQLGVWKALEEGGIRGSAVSGTSVGALNAALYAQGDYDRAVDAWMSISNKKLLQPNWEELCSKFPELAAKVVGQKVAKKIGKVMDPQALSSLLSSLFPNLGKTFGVFSQKGLIWLMDNYLDFSRRNDFLPTFVACHNKTDHAVEYFRLFPEPDRETETAKKILLASAAIPYVFDNIEIDGKMYSDGGFDIIYSLSDETIQSSQYNNSPIEPLAEHASELGINNIVLLALNRDELTHRPKYGSLRVLPLLPSRSLGGLTDGCLDFDPEHAKKRIAQGYRDARKWLDLLKGFMDDEKRISEIWDRILGGEEDYLGANKKIGVGFTGSADIEKDIARFNEIIISDDGTAELEAERHILSLEERLKKGDLALIDAQRRAELDHLVECLVDENRQNSELLNGYAMDAVAALAPVESRATELLEQGFFGRLWHGITGKNAKMVSTSILDLAQAQYASIRLVQQLQHENLLQFELTGALHARLNRLASDAARIQGNVNCQVREVYNSLALVYCKVRKQLRDHEDRLQALEHKTNALIWSRTAHVKHYCGKSFDALPAPVKLLAAAMDFYFVADGQPTEEDLMLFQGVLKDTKLAKELISIDEMIEKSRQISGLIPQYKEDFRTGDRVGADRENWLPAVFEGAKLTASGSGLRQPAVLLASELFYLLRANHWVPRKSRESGIRADYLKRCGDLRTLVEQNADDLGKKILPEIAELEERIRGYYFKINLIGPFSSGKSSLLNAWLGQEILPTGIAPETAVASELMYSQEEKVVLFPMDESLPVETLPGVGAANFQRVKNRANAGELLKVQIFLNNAKLQRYPDICLVDMPGLSSGLKAHEAALNQFILDAGTGIFCVPAYDGTIQSDGERFLERMTFFDNEFYLLLTKADQKTASERKQILTTCKEIIHGKFGFPVKTGIVSVREKNIGIGDFTKLLDALLDQKDNIFKGKFDGDLQELCAECIAPLKKILAHDFSSGELEAEMEKLGNLRGELPQILSRISSGIDRKIPAETNAVVERIKTTLYGLRSGLKAQIKAKQDCSGEITSNMRSVALFEIQNRANNIFNDAIRQAGEAFGEKLTFSITAGDISGESANGLKGGNYKGTGTAVGALAGLILGGPGGAVLGGFIGRWLGGKVDDDSELDAQLDSVLDRSAENARPIVREAFESAAAKFKDDLKAAMTAKLARLEEQNQALRRKLEENQAEFDKAKAAREETLNKLLGISPGERSAK